MSLLHFYAIPTPIQIHSLSKKNPFFFPLLFVPSLSKNTITHRGEQESKLKQHTHKKKKEYSMKAKIVYSFTRKVAFGRKKNNTFYTVLVLNDGPSD